MIQSFDLMNIQFHACGMAESLDLLEKFIRERTPRMVFSLSAELIARAHEDPFVRDVYARTDLLTVDSYVVYYAARLCGRDIHEPVSASRIMCNFLPRATSNGYRLYLLGAAQDVVSKAVEALKDQYPGIVIAGWRNGFFTQEEERAVVDDIRRAAPDILLVAMSSPLKERFISLYRDVMNVPVSMGVGGIFDIVAGKCSLAPPLVSKMGLEWLYRFVQEPRRMWKRYLFTNTKFLLLLIRQLLLRGA